MFNRNLIIRTGVVLALCWTAAPLAAAEPIIRTINLRGLQIGATTTLTLDGDDLTGVRLLLPFPAKQELKPGSTDKKAILDVTLDAAVVPGYYQFWGVTDGGVSTPTLIGVDRLPQKIIEAKTEQLPIAWHGSVPGAGTVETKFPGKAKQRLLVDVEAQRLGSKLRPIIHLLSPKNLQLAWSWGSPSLHGDCRLEAILPEDGLYTVTLHDGEYAAPAPSYFRLKIGDVSTVDQVFPPVLSRGKAQTVELLGPSKTERLDVPAPKNLGFLQLPWPKDGVWSGPRPFVIVGTHTEFIKETVAAGKLQELPLGPVAVSGRLLTPFDEDRYRLAVTPNKKIRLEVFAERIGSPLDAAVVVRNEKGDLLVRGDDSPGTLDPVLEYAVPDKVTAVIIGVVDAQGRAGARGIYRLVVDPQTATTTGGEGWKLSTTTSRLAMPVAGRVVTPVYLDRQGYLGKVDLTASLPAGVKALGTLIPEGADGTLLTLERSDAPLAATIIQWTGKGLDGSDHPVVIKQHPLEKLQPWLATEIALAGITAKASDFAVDWRDFPADASLSLGGKLVLPFKVARTRDKTSVKLTLLTSQSPPALVNNQIDPAKALRQEKPIEVAVNLPNGDVTLLVPPELSAPAYDVTVQAELLDAGKKVLATTYAPVRRLAVKIPLFVQLTGPNRLVVALDPKKGPTTFAIKGKIDRKDGLKGDVALTLTGLPAGVTAAPVTVKADAADFIVNVVLPPTTPAGEIKGLKLTGTIGVDAKLPALRVRSQDVDVTLVVMAAK